GPQPPPGSSQGIRAHPASSPGREKSQTDDGGHSSPSSQFFETQPCGSIVAGRRCVLVGSQMKSSLAHTPDSAHGMGTHPLPSGGASSGAQRNPSRQSKATLGTKAAVGPRARLGLAALRSYGGWQSERAIHHRSEER